jgi:hypothetical protein
VVVCDLVGQWRSRSSLTICASYGISKRFAGKSVECGQIARDSNTMIYLPPPFGS